MKKYLNNFLDNSLKHLFFLVFITMMFPPAWIAIQTNDVDKIIGSIEMFTMVSATLAILSFTYALAKKKNDKEQDSELLKIGEEFFKSTVLYVLGLVVLDFSMNYFLTAESKFLNTFIQVSKIFWFVIAPISVITILISFHKFSSGIAGVYFYFKKNKKL